MTETGSPETKVGIFAIKNDVVNSVLEHFGRENMTVGYVQMAPMALYNYVLYDRADLGSSENQAIVVLDIGAENTDLVVCTKSTVWQRCIPMGGNAFTRAIADAFKLNFQRAEKLKRTAPMSKYARQIFQAMRPVFTDLVSEIQRSLNFYSSSNPNTKLLKVIALGGGTKMRGLLKYLRQTLQVPVERPDSFKKLAMRSGVSPAKFHENVSDFGIVYGLAVQGLGLAGIESNLLPRGIARSMAWVGKAKYFTAAACMLLLVSLMCFARTSLDRVSYRKKDGYRLKTESVINAAKQASRKLKEQEGRGIGSEATIKKAFEPFAYRDVVPLLHQTMISALPNEINNRDQAKLYKAFADGDVKAVRQFDRKERKQIFVTGMSVRFVDDVETASLDGARFGFAKTKRKRDKEKGLDERAMRELARWGAMAKYRPRQFVEDGEKAEEDRAGFVATIEGYSPYEELGELMDPAKVEDEPNKWGVITRWLHLDDVDANSPFRLYKKTNPKHFKLETEAVDVGPGTPLGIGIFDVRSEKAEEKETVYGASGEQVLVDPMTKEIISKVAKPNGEEELNDHWFVLKLKLIWKDAPKDVGLATQPATGRTGRAAWAGGSRGAGTGKPEGRASR
ncbi:MAG: pilus assembly protein PilM [Planctomycetota bacterium]|jgi:type IV pilus assembly protein PilM